MGLCLLAGSALAGAAVYRYAFWGNELPNGYAASVADTDADGMADYLVLQAKVDLPETGRYDVHAMLYATGSDGLVAETSGSVVMDRGTNVFGTAWLGSDVAASGVTGPYVAKLQFTRSAAIGPFEGRPNLALIGRLYEVTYAFDGPDASAFAAAKAPVSFTGDPSAELADWDGDGLVDQIAVSAPIVVRREGDYLVQIDMPELLPVGRPVIPFEEPRFTFPEFQHMQPGMSTVSRAIWGPTIYLSGFDGTVNVRFVVSNARLVEQGHDCCGIPPTFETGTEFAPPPEGAVLGLRQPYLLPPTPVSFVGETVLESLDIRWYDMEAPEMPVEFTGDVRDYGVDADGDGLYDALAVEASVLVRIPGTYDVSGTLYGPGTDPYQQVSVRSAPDPARIVSTAWSRVQLDPRGPDTSVSVRFPGAEILAGGADGTFQAKLRIVPANVYIDPVIVHTTSSYAMEDFEASGAKPAVLRDVAASAGDLEYRIDVTASSGSGYDVTVRVIHANGVVALDARFGPGGTVNISFWPGTAKAEDFTVAVYLQISGGEGVDYREIPLA